MHASNSRIGNERGREERTLECFAKFHFKVFGQEETH